MPENSDFKRACFIPQSGPDKGQAVDVHFNPGTLQYTVVNTLENQGSGNKTKQYVSQSTAKLSMDLIFDTTADGQDVRIFTEKIARFMMPDEKKAPPVVLFEWGTYKFQGMVEAYRETLDFFAPSGVPLRAAVSLTLSKQDDVFAPSAKGDRVNTSGSLAGIDPGAVQAPPDASPSSISSLAGDPRAARGIAQANGSASLRFGAGASLTVSASVALKPPVAFATGGASLSAGGGAGFGLGAGASIGGGVGMGSSASIGGSVGGGASAGIGIGAGAGIGSGTGFSISGGAASAGVSATEGAFAGLKAPATSAAPAELDLKRLLPKPASPELATDSGASFAVGGRATMEAASSQRADVGARASLQFED